MILEESLIRVSAARESAAHSTRAPLVAVGGDDGVKHVGASEFVIRPGSVVQVTSIITRDTYCAQ